ncbi:MAG TPA: amidase family protein, partial [Candidatus Mcinerneyibacteriales bacterium]|nr:amidase family protein [Candidatus Mcinerneyibacteriales bacterium]
SSSTPPCARSSGSAAAVAAGLVPMAVGTETSGSIIYPSSQNSVVGLKPTVGLVSRNCIIPIAEAQDTAGPMTRSVRDAALLLSVMAGKGPGDPATGKAPKAPRLKGLFSEKERPLEGLRFGLVSNRAMRRYYYRGDEGAIQLRIAGELARAGAEVVFIEMDEAIYEKLDVSTVFQYQFKEGVNEYLEKWVSGEGPRTLAEIIAFNAEKPSERMPLGQELLIAAQDNSHTADKVLETVRSNARFAGECIDKLLKEHRADILFSLSNHMSYVYAAAGYPALCVPAGYKSGGEPIGVTFVASAGEEGLLLKAAYGYEQATGHHTPPAAVTGE